MLAQRLCLTGDYRGGMNHEKEAYSIFQNKVRFCVCELSFCFENAIVFWACLCGATVRWRSSSNQMQLWLPEEHYPAGCACRAVNSSGRRGAFWNTAWGKLSSKLLSNRADMWRLAFVLLNTSSCFSTAGFGSLSGHNAGAARSGQWHTEDFIQVKRL